MNKPNPIPLALRLTLFSFAKQGQIPIVSKTADIDPECTTSSAALYSVRFYDPNFDGGPGSKNK
jgi:hypothetical protein